MSKNEHKLTVMALVMMIFTSVYGFTNGPRGFLLMGYASIFWYIIAALGFFIPYAFMMAEFGSAFKDSKGGIYSWMERSVGPRYAFMGLIMWYASYTVWMVNVSNGIWVPLSTFIFGRDSTREWTIGGLSYGQVLGLFAVGWMALIAIISSFGIKRIASLTRIGGLAVWGLNFVLIIGGLIVLALNGKIQFNLDGVQNFSLFLKSPNPDYQSTVKVFSFFVFAIFAFGGLEAVAGLVDKTENAEKNFPRGLIVSSLVIAVGYSLCILAIGTFVDWPKVIVEKHNGNVNLANAVYVMMGELGYQLSLALHQSENTAAMVGQIFARYTGLSMFLSLTGAFFTLFYSPLKQLIEGTPRDMWPEFLIKEKNGVPVNAFIAQTIIVIFFILLNALGGKGAEAFFLKITSATNVAMTIPYMFLAIAFYFFKKNDSIPKSFSVYNKTTATLAVILVTLVVGFANVFAIFEPVILRGSSGLEDTLTYIAGPLFFIIVGFALSSRGAAKKSVH